MINLFVLGLGAFSVVGLAVTAVLSQTQHAGLAPLITLALFCPFLLILARLR